MRRFFLKLGVFLTFVYCGYGQSTSFRTFMNPVIPGDHPDCTLSKIGNYFYTTGSSFNPTPVIYRSTDLVHWEAVAQPVRADWSGYGDAPAGGCWGGQVVYYNNKYWHFFSRANTMYFTTADSITGEWTMPTQINCPPSVPGLGYDNSIFIDDDGKWYLLVKNGQVNNWIVELGSDGQPQGAIYNLCWINPAPSYPYSWAEGPVMWKYKGYYYYSFARDVAGGQKVMRSPILTDDSSSWTMLGDFFNENDPLKSQSLFQGPNHSSAVVTLDDSTHWVIHPTWRDANNNEWFGQGRQGLLAQVFYDANGKPTADYPVNIPKDAPRLPSNGIPWMVPHSDFFNSSRLNPEWSFLGYTPASSYSLTARTGWFALSQKGKPNTIIKRCAEHNYSLITKLDFAPQSVNDQAGIWIFNGLQTLYVKLYSSIDSSGNKIIAFSYKDVNYKVNNPAGQGDNIVFLKLVRVNHILTGYFSLEGYNWTQVGNSIDVTDLDGEQPDWNAWTGNRQGLFVQGNTTAYFDYYIYRDAYTPILAECPANQFGTTITSRVGGISSLDNIHDGDWALYAGVEFGNDYEYPIKPEAVSFVASSATLGGVIEVWLDSIDTGTKIAECNIANTGSWNTFQTFTANITTPVSGNHDVYLKFKGSGTEKLFILQWLKFIGVTSDCYKSHQSGQWNDPNTWDYFNGTSWQYPALSPPSVTKGQITIRSGHQVVITESDSIDQLCVQTGGELVIESDANFIIKNGPGMDLEVLGILKNYGNLEMDDLAISIINNGGKYVHARDGGKIPNFLWINGSTCEVTGVVSNLPLNMNQNFYHFTWNCTAQATDVNLGWNDITIGGNIIIQNTGTGALWLCNPSVGTHVDIGINGDLNQSGGTFVLHVSSDEGAVVRINQGGSINVTGGVVCLTGGEGAGELEWNLSGNFNMSSGEFAIHSLDSGSVNVTMEHSGNVNITGGLLRLNDGLGSMVWNLTSGNITISNAEVQKGTAMPLGSGFILKKAGIQTITIGSGNSISALPIEVRSGTTLNMGTNELVGNGHFVLDSGATMETAHASGIDGNIQIGGPKMLSKKANYTYSGSVAQVTGNLLPDTVNNLTLNNSSGLTLSKNVVVNGVMEIKKGNMQSSGGSSVIYGVDGVLKYSGSSTQTTGEAEFSENSKPKDLVISNTVGVVLHASRQIRGNLQLGGKLVVGSNTITAGSLTTGSVATMYVNTDGGGKLRLPVGNSAEVLYPIGASGSSSVTYCPVWIRNDGAGDTISVGAVKDTVYQNTKPRVKLKWELIEDEVGGGNYTIKFGWNHNSHENNLFKSDRYSYARIFRVEDIDTLEAGSGNYEFQFSVVPYSVKRGNILELGTFVVGKFADSVWQEVEKGKNIAGNYQLYQNYPNPFNAVTTIAYEVPTAEQVTLLICNALGQEVARLVNERKSAGRYEVRWDASNMPTGVYFYRLTAGSFIATRKLLLIK